MILNEHKFDIMKKVLSCVLFYGFVDILFFVLSHIVCKKLPYGKKYLFLKCLFIEMFYFCEINNIFC